MTSPPAHASSSRSAKLLFIDDEQRVLTSMKALFRRHYQVFIADSGAKALAFLERESVDIVISDQRMPGMTGVEVLSAIKRQHPDIIRILLTGYADLEAVEASINDCEVFRYLMKPCPSDELMSVIKLALDRDKVVTPREAQLIEFPSGNRSERDRSKPARSARPKTSRRSEAEILVLSPDRELVSAIKSAADGATICQARSLEAALNLLQTRPVGVIVTDTAADKLDIQQVTLAIRTRAPGVVPIVASQRSDAASLIELINSGDIYRFLLKPVSKGQCRLWLASAMRRHNELSSATSGSSAISSSAQQAGLLKHLWRSCRRLAGVQT